MALRYLVTTPGSCLIIGDAADSPGTLAEGTVFIEADTGKVKRRGASGWNETNVPGSGGGGGPSNMDGGAPDSDYGGTIAIDGGTP